MKKEDTQILKKSIQSIIAIIIVIVLAFYEVPRVARDAGFYYFLLLISYGILAVFFSDVILKPNFQNLGQRLAFSSIPLVYIVLVVIIRVIFNIFTLPLAYFIITTLLITVMCSSAIKAINKAFVNINEQEIENRKIKINEGVKKIRMDEIRALMKQNDILIQDNNFKHEFDLLDNAIKYGNPIKVKEADDITKEINDNIESISEMIKKVDVQTDTSQLIALIKKTKLMTEEKDKIVQLYYN